jgi:hypothetical protein
MNLNLLKTADEIRNIRNEKKRVLEAEIEKRVQKCVNLMIQKIEDNGKVSACDLDNNFHPDYVESAFQFLNANGFVCSGDNGDWVITV